MQHFGVWIGLYRKPDNEFYWIDDTPVTGQFSAWAKGEPNSGQEKCANIYLPENSHHWESGMTSAVI